MKITVYGSGCARCKQTEDLIRHAIAEAGADADVEKVADMQAIVMAGVLSTPAVAVNGQLKLSGRVPRLEEIRDWLRS